MNWRRTFCSSLDFRFSSAAADDFRSYPVGCARFSFFEFRTSIFGLTPGLVTPSRQEPPTDVPDPHATLHDLCLAYDDFNRPALLEAFLRWFVDSADSTDLAALPS